MATELTIDQAITELDILLEEYDWYYLSEAIDDKNIVVYVDHMGPVYDSNHISSNKIIYTVPDKVPEKVGKFDVRMWFSAFAECDENYGPITLEELKESKKTNGAKLN